MKLSKVLSAFILVSGAVAVYPPPEGVDTNAEGLVTIQNVNQLENNKNLDTKDSEADQQLPKSSVPSGDSKKKAATSLHDSETLTPFYSFYLAISMIVVSEIGDKTFLIAAIMAMRYPRMVVFSAASSALVIMTVLSGAIGHILPQLLSPTITRTAAANLLSYISSPIWYQTFMMTFLGEWGDRSQITTIAMAAGADWDMIILGGSIGHVLCTLLAVLGGKYVSTKISLKTILLGGSIAFFIFSGLYGYSAYYE
ncbi:GDT1-like protein 4 [Pichia kudriavzevii]|uniref:GDT1 family protein n=1 Tax=Pichia kudriavzevii TaxID=4909 RepID=A0A1V2LIB3_PICKU|nr:GDT1-like protein 4 [Pichia kudriavzevii]